MANFCMRSFYNREKEQNMYTTFTTHNNNQIEKLFHCRVWTRPKTKEQIYLQEKTRKIMKKRSEEMHEVTNTMYAHQYQDNNTNMYIITDIIL